MQRDGLTWRLWCFVEEGSECSDMEDGRSFKGCQNGCPKGIEVEESNSIEGYEGFLALKDGCKEEEAWLAPEEAVNENASILFNMGCIITPRRLYLKNTPQSFGGTENFTIYIGDTARGPFRYIASGQIKQSETAGCIQQPEIFQLDPL